MVRSNNVFNFGKYRGLTAGEVARRDPGYIYFVENEMGHRFTPKVKRQAYDTVQRRRRYDDEYDLYPRRNQPDFY